MSSGDACSRKVTNSLTLLMVSVSGCFSFRLSSDIAWVRFFRGESWFYCPKRLTLDFCLLLFIVHEFHTSLKLPQFSSEARFRASACSLRIHRQQGTCRRLGKFGDAPEDWLLASFEERLRGLHLLHCRERDWLLSLRAELRSLERSELGHRWVLLGAPKHLVLGTANVACAC